MFYDKFKNINHLEKGFKFLDEIDSQGHANMHLAWQDLFNDYVEKNNPLLLKDVFFICKRWNCQRKGTSELKFYCSNIDFLIESRKELIDFYHAEFERDGDESNIEQVVKHRLDILKLRGLSNIQEIQEAIYEMLF